MTLAFGDRVVVAFEAVRVIGENEGPLRVPDPADPGTGGFRRMLEDPDGKRKLHFHDSRPRRSAGRYRTWDALDDPALRIGPSPWPGRPVPVDWAEPISTSLSRPYELEPEWKALEVAGRSVPPHTAYARIRRFDCSQPGILIGRTWRDEGVPKGPENSWDDGDTGYLILERKVPLFEVVLEPTGKLGKATLILAAGVDLVLAPKG